MSVRFNTNTIVLDLETTDCDLHSIIEVGAAMLDKKLDIVSTFKSMVKPYAPVSQRLTEITGYTEADVADAPTWPAVAEKFWTWVESYGGRNKCRLACWGNYFDVNVLRANYAHYGLDYPFNGVAYDIKTAATMWLSLSGGRTDSISVQKMTERLGIEVAGRFHTAFTDAMATALIFKAIMKGMAGGLWLDGKYVELKVRP